MVIVETSRHQLGGGGLKTDLSQGGDREVNFDQKLVKVIFKMSFFSRNLCNFFKYLFFCIFSRIVVLIISSSFRRTFNL